MWVGVGYGAPHPGQWPDPRLVLSAAARPPPPRASPRLPPPPRRSCSWGAGPRGSSSRSRIWGAVPARREAWGTRGPRLGPGPKRAELRTDPLRDPSGSGAAQWTSGPEAPGAGEGAGVARAPWPGSPVRGWYAPSLRSIPKSGSPLGQTSLNRGAVLAQKSPLPLPVLSSEPLIRGGGSAAGKPPSLGWIPNLGLIGASNLGAVALGPGPRIQGQTPVSALIPADSPMSRGCQSWEAPLHVRPPIYRAAMGLGRPLYCPPALELRRRRALPASRGIPASHLSSPGSMPSRLPPSGALSPGPGILGGSEGNPTLQCCIVPPLCLRAQEGPG